MLSQLCSLPEGKTGKLPRDFDQMGKSPALKYLPVFCARSSGTSHLREVVQPSRLRTIPTGTAGKHSAVHMPHIFLLSNSFPDTLDVFPAEQFRIYIQKTDSFIRDRRKSVVTGSDYSVWWILLSYVQGK